MVETDQDEALALCHLCLKYSAVITIVAGKRKNVYSREKELVNESSTYSSYRTYCIHHYIFHCRNKKPSS